MALARLRRISADDAVERTVLVAVPVEAPNEVAAVLMAKRDGDVLGGPGAPSAEDATAFVALVDARAITPDGAGPGLRRDRRELWVIGRAIALCIRQRAALGSAQ